MPTIYQSIKDGHVITEPLDVTIKSRSFILDLADATHIVAYPLSELATLGEAFDVIAKYFPDYEHCGEAAWLDDLDCLIDNECDNEKLIRLTQEYGSDPEYWKIQREELYQQMLAEAIKNYRISSKWNQ